MDPDAGNNDTVTEDLEQEKLRLEIEQLRHGRQRVDYRIRLIDLAQPLITLLIAAGTIIFAHASGLLDAKRLELSAKSERFATENMLAEARQREMQSQYEALAARVDSFRSIVENTEKMRQVAKRLNEDPALDVSLDFLEEPPEISVSVFVGELAASPDYKLDLDGLFRDLGSIEPFVKLGHMKITSVTLSRNDIAAIAALNPRHLELSGNKLGNGEAVPLGKLRLTKSISISHQPLDELSWLSTVPNLESLQIASVPIDGSDFEQNFDFAESLRSLVLNDVSVGDEIVQIVSHLPRLRLLAIKDTSVSTEGMRNLISRVSLNLIAEIDASDCQLNELRAIRDKSDGDLQIGNFDSGLDFQTRVNLHEAIYDVLGRYTRKSRE